METSDRTRQRGLYQAFAVEKTIQSARDVQAASDSTGCSHRQQAASAGSLVLPVSDKNKTKECNTDCLAWLNKLFE